MENKPDDAECTRPPLMTDLVELCRELNLRNAKYIVIGGMAINIHGFARNTEDIDLLIETEKSNESKILEVLALLPVGAAKELRPGEVAEYVVVRVCDEITVDLMAKACGHDYASAKDMVTPVVVEGITIPFASPTLLWKTKQTHREKGDRPLVPPQAAGRPRRVAGGVRRGGEIGCFVKRAPGT